MSVFGILLVEDRSHIMTIPTHPPPPIAELFYILAENLEPNPFLLML